MAAKKGAKKKYPKAPKASASLTVWEKHKDKIKEIDKFNSQLETDKKKKTTLIKTVQKMKSK